MSRGSTLTLYRAYKNFKIDKDGFKKSLKMYVERNKEGIFGEKHTKKELESDIPIVMSTKLSDDYIIKDNVHYRVKAKTADEYRAWRFTKYFLRDTKQWCDKLLEWDFTSGFDCLIEHFNLNYYNYKDSEIVITKDIAKQMLQAIEYLLGGEWNDKIEREMRNPFIHIFAEGGHCDSYWKYVYRNAHKKNIKFKQSGFEISVKIPVKTKRDIEDDCDAEYQAELNESNSQCEFYMRNMENGLRAFLESDTWTEDDDYELILVYSCWG